MTQSVAESLSAAGGREKVRQECRKGGESVEQRRYHGVNEALWFGGVASSSLTFVGQTSRWFICKEKLRSQPE